MRTMASLALRNFVALTNFIAFVICWVEIVEAILLRISFCPAMV
jgi:hypothetical protein